jgi:hypothetical protein
VTDTVVEVYSLNKQNLGKMRCTRVIYHEAFELHVDGKVVYSSFPKEAASAGLDISLPSVTRGPLFVEEKP